MEAEKKTIHGLSIGTVTFDLGWPWTVLDLVYMIFASTISNTVRDSMLDTMEVGQETTNGISIGTVNFDPRWPWTVLVQGHLST